MDTLPEDIILGVTNWLPIGGVPSCRFVFMGRVCKTWRDAVRNNIQLQLEQCYGSQYKRIRLAYDTF